jgi:hypothetical protein
MRKWSLGFKNWNKTKGVEVKKKDGGGCEVWVSKS